MAITEMTEMGRLLPVCSESAGVGLPLHCSHTKRDDRNLPDSGRSIGGALTLKGLVDGTSILYLDHIQEQGVALFDQCVKFDLEGIVAKPEISSYREVKGKTTGSRSRTPNIRRPRGEGTC